MIAPLFELWIQGRLVDRESTAFEYEQKLNGILTLTLIRMIYMPFGAVATIFRSVP
mgnify:CR=1 FL=1